MKKIYILASLALLLLIQGNAQTLITPAPEQSGPILLKGGTAHLGNGEVIENAMIGFADGKLTIVSSNADTNGYQVIDVSGKHVYPGFILPATDLGLTEVESLRATLDKNEQGMINPNVRSIIAYNTDSELIPTMRFNGILMAQVRPFGGLVSGSSSVVQLDAWNWEDAVMAEDQGIFMSWPSRERRQFDFATFQFDYVENKNYPGQVEMLKSLLEEGKAYMSAQNPTANLKLEAMKGLFDGSKTLYIGESVAKNIIESVKFAKSQGVQKIVIVGGEEAYLITDFLKEHDIPVILNNVHDLPRREDDDVDMPYKMPYLLSKKGIKVSLLYSGTQSARNLPFFAGTAATYGLGKEEALKLITLNTASILGIDDKVGSLEVGKNATLFVSEGDALDMRGNIVTHAFIDGREIQLEATQQVLFQKYKKKYSGE